MAHSTPPPPHSYPPPPLPRHSACCFFPQRICTDMFVVGNSEPSQVLPSVIIRLAMIPMLMLFGVQFSTVVVNPDEPEVRAPILVLRGTLFPRTRVPSQRCSLQMRTTCRRCDRMSPHEDEESLSAPDSQLSVYTLVATLVGYFLKGRCHLTPALHFGRVDLVIPGSR